MPQAGPGVQTAFRELRHVDVVSHGQDVPQSHHGVVLVYDVVAVDWILADPVAEAEEELDTLVGMQLRDILSRALNGQRRSGAVTREDLVFLKVDVNGVRQ